MELILGILFGGIVSWIVTKIYYDKSSKDFESGMESPNKLIGKLIKSIDKLLKELAPKDAETAESISKEIEEDFEVIKEETKDLPEGVLSSTYIDAIGRYGKCPEWGEPLHGDGFDAGPDGILYWWKRCPKHGRFPDEIMDY